jgi:hypothetical protein
MLGDAEPEHRRGGGGAMLTILIVIGVVLCCGLCGYGIDRAVRRAKERRVHDAAALAGR